MDDMVAVFLFLALRKDAFNASGTWKEQDSIHHRIPFKLFFMRISMGWWHRKDFVVVRMKEGFLVFMYSEDVDNAHLRKNDGIGFMAEKKIDKIS